MEIVYLTLIDFVLSAALLVAIFKIPRLRNRAAGGLNIAMSYLSGYFRSVQTVNTETNPRDEMRRAVVTGLLANQVTVAELSQKVEEAMDQLFPPADFSDDEEDQDEEDQDEEDENHPFPIKGGEHENQ